MQGRQHIPKWLVKSQPTLQAFPSGRWPLKRPERLKRIRESSRSLQPMDAPVIQDWRISLTGGLQEHSHKGQVAAVADKRFVSA